ncbi:unnamed protein product, partial [Mesorhabditis belari]|uniref:Uncharacterized protein n=1 Tax=Mesorhabditis belari TaxID=2138241 RepID=A0AAF3J9D9_9BILA
MRLDRITQLTILLVISSIFLFGAFLADDVITLLRFYEEPEESRDQLRQLGFTKGVMLTLWLSMFVHAVLYVTSIVLTFFGVFRRSRLILWACPICLIYSLESLLGSFTGGIFSGNWVDILTATAMLFGSLGVFILLSLNFAFLFGAYVCSYIVALRRLYSVSADVRLFLRLLGFTKGVMVTLYM